MPVGINIADTDIANAERVLLPAGKIFDDERRAFIKRLDTLDLHAVPGSGKTTAMLAKIMALDRHLPFQNGSGILVISHTNAAVDEIKRRLGDHCRKLFSYPNFLGTIQGFVDQFLAIPYYVNVFQRRPARIDNEIYSERANRFSREFLPGYSQQEQSDAKYFLHSNKNVAAFRFARTEGRITLLSGINGKPLTIKKPNARTDWSEHEKTRVADWLTDFKRRIMTEGYLCFDDAYYFANCLLSEVLKARDVLQERFPYVFVDEMQDMGRHQHDLLESLFYDGGRSRSAYQRIGDRNQGIHNSIDFDVESVWEERPIVLALTNSCRLSSPIARVIQPFAVHNPSACHLNGLGEADIRPHMIVFSDSSRMQVLREFATLLKTLIVQGRLPSGSDTTFKAVAWNAEWSEDTGDHGNKIRLTDYHPVFRRAEQRPPIDHGCVGDYVTLSFKTTQPFREAYSSILNLFLKVLRMEGVRYPIKDCHFTATSLRRYLRENHSEFCEAFLLRIYRWALASVRQELASIEDEVRATIPSLLEVFGRGVDHSREFINSARPSTPEQSQPTYSFSNTYVFDGVTIELATVHAVKGQTHTATLYLESYYQQDGRGEGAKSYESQRLAPQFLGHFLSGSEGTRVKQSAKMTYVGFSRPSHLLCFAVHTDRFEKHLCNIDMSAWEIIRIDDQVTQT